MGFLRSGTLISTIGAAFTNNTGSAITALSISYTGEQWRLGTAARTDRLDFQYSVNATSLTTGTWIDADALDFITPTVVTIGAKDGNAAANRTAISASLSGLSIANGATFYIRWNDFDATGVDDGLAVDEFTLSTSLSTLPVSMISFSATRNNTGSTINWTTAQEVNSREFIVERAAGDGRTWQSIARIAAAGQSHAMLEYQVQDPHPLSGVNLYRLKSIDMDHNFSFSAICRVIFDSKYNYSLYPNPVINNLQVSAGDGRGFNGHIIICTLQGHAVLYKESRQSGAFINLDISLLKTGMYVLKIIADDGEINSLKFTKL
ncbi:MAG: T9SS type A sorting domain-containing protein [Bacteroidota bacterium]